jgi:hypothetical protein
VTGPFRGQEMHRSRIPYPAARGAGTRESEPGHRDERRVLP